jgi:hypothetical protein
LFHRLAGGIELTIIPAGQQQSRFRARVWKFSTAAVTSKANSVCGKHFDNAIPPTLISLHSRRVLLVSVIELEKHSPASSPTPVNTLWDLSAAGAGAVRRPRPKGFA